MTTAHTCAALTTDCVDLVDEDDARAVLLGLLEEVTHARGADTDEHLDEIGTRDGEEGHARLARDRTREQSLAGSRRTVEQNAARNLGAERLVARWILQEILDLVQFFDSFVGARDILESSLRHVLGELLGLRLTEAHHTAASTTLHLHHDEDEHAEQKNHRQHEQQQRGQPAVLGDDGVVAVQPVRADLVENGFRRRIRVFRENLSLALRGVVAFLQSQANLLLTVVDLRLLDVLRIELRDRHRRVDGLPVARVVSEVAEGEDHHQNAENDGQVPYNCLPIHTASAETASSFPVNSDARIPAAHRMLQATANGHPVPEVHRPHSVAAPTHAFCIVQRPPRANGSPHRGPTQRNNRFDASHPRTKELTEQTKP